MKSHMFSVVSKQLYLERGIPDHVSGCIEKSLGRLIAV
jgi:hypothetical protein